MVSTRTETEAAEQEYESFLLQSGLEHESLRHARLEELDLSSALRAEDLSGVFIGGSPYDAGPDNGKTRSQLHVEDQVREILATTLKIGMPVLATGFALEVLAGYLGTATSRQYAEPLGYAEVFLTAEGRQDPLLQGLPQTFEAFVGHHEGAVDTPEHATLLASSPDCPVQMIRVGTTMYGTQFNPELDVERYIQRVSIYAEAGYGQPDQIDDVLTDARLSTTEHVAGRIIRHFAEHFAHD